MRNYLIAGNWKMNKTPDETTALINGFKAQVAEAACGVMVAVPFVDIPAALEATRGTNIRVAAENCHWAASGAFTGEISAPMLKTIGVDAVIIGHSERRTLFGETDDTVKMRVRAALDSGLDVILCVGETLDQRGKGITNEICAMQVKIALGGVSEQELAHIVIAYEPVWAIGPGKNATAEQANEVCAAIRGVVGGLYSAQAAGRLTVQYGGSMDAANAAELLAQPDVDGGLIGGASLKPADFAAIVAAATAQVRA